MPRKMDMPGEEEFAAPEIRRRPRNFWTAIVIIVLLLAVGAWLGAKVVGMEKADSPYSAVYLSTGDIYFGKLEWFPKPHLENPLYLQRGEEQIALVPFRDVFWGPSENLYLNPKEMIFWARIRSDSPLVQAIENPQAAAGGNQAPIVAEEEESATSSE